MFSNPNNHSVASAFKPTSKDSVEQDASSDMALWSIVYHAKPIGNNYIFGGQKGEITGFVNATKKRAIVKWENGTVKKHNVSSLSSTRTIVGATKKRKCVENKHVAKKRKITREYMAKIQCTI